MENRATQDLTEYCISESSLIIPEKPQVLRPNQNEMEIGFGYALSKGQFPTDFLDIYTLE